MSDKQERTRGSVLEVFMVFLRLGCVSFGGPVAHLGYFQKELVAQRRWCDEDTFAGTIALAQSLPGPSSSQVCFAMGVIRAGWLGGVAAWTAFTLPSALLMFVPGPLFTFGAFLGTSIRGTSHHVLFGCLGLFGLSAPGLLAMGAALPFWGNLRGVAPVQGVLRGINAAVVGILIAALYKPLWTSSVRTSADLWFALLAFTLLVVGKVQPWIVVLSISLIWMLAG
jgi:chromate transport protein ChrA